jgi:hypothetical protein
LVQATRGAGRGGGGGGDGGGVDLDDDDDIRAMEVPAKLLFFFLFYLLFFLLFLLLGFAAFCPLNHCTDSHVCALNLKLNARMRVA